MTVTMNKNTSMVLVAAVAGIMVAGALALTLATSNAYAFQISVGGDGGIGGAGGAGGVAGNGGSNEVEHAGGGNHQSANGGDANGGDGGDANGGDAAACHSECGARA